MPSKKVEAPQVSELHGVTTEIRFASKATVNIRDNYFSFEYEERRLVPLGSDLDAETAALTERCNGVVDDQINQILEASSK